MDSSEIIDGNKLQDLEQLVYQDRLVEVHAGHSYVAYCVKEFNQSTKTNAINVFVHSANTMRTTRMTNNTSGASHSAVIVAGIVGAEDMVCFLRDGSVHAMSLGGGCQQKVAGEECGHEILGFKIFIGPENRVWMLAVVDIAVVATAEKSPAKATGMIFDSLMIRHWTEWGPYKKRHHLMLFELSVTAEGLLAVRAEKEPTDVMQGLETDCPG